MSNSQVRLRITTRGILSILILIAVFAFGILVAMPKEHTFPPCASEDSSIATGDMHDGTFCYCYYDDKHNH